MNSILYFGVFSLIIFCAVLVYLANDNFIRMLIVGDALVGIVCLAYIHYKEPPTL